MLVSLHRLLEPWKFLSCRVRSSFPEQGVTSHNLYILQRCANSMRDLILAAQPGVLSHPHFLGVGPGIRPKPITALRHNLAHPPFCIQRAFGLAHTAT